MHIPDNYLSPSTCTVLGAAMLPIWKRVANNVKKEISRKKMPLIGICSAFSFLIMMFNIPLPGGTTGHATGAALAAILLGPHAAVLAITIALGIQALFFGDGGILAFGANCFNMAFIMPFIGFYSYKFFTGIFKRTKSTYISAFVSAYISINAAAFFAAIEFGIQPLLFTDTSGLPLYCPYNLNISIPAMLIPHLLVVGFLEGGITTAVLTFIKKTAPDTIYNFDNSNLKPMYKLLIALIILSPLGLLAAGTAWGEWGSSEIQEILGFIPQGMKKGFNFNSLMPDYAVNGIPEIFGYILSAVIGVILIIFIIKLFSKINLNKN